jgi:hypothetical protein
MHSKLRLGLLLLLGVSCGGREGQQPREVFQTRTRTGMTPAASLNPTPLRLRPPPADPKVRELTISGAAFEPRAPRTVLSADGASFKLQAAEDAH